MGSMSFSHCPPTCGFQRKSRTRPGLNVARAKRVCLNCCEKDAMTPFVEEQMYMGAPFLKGTLFGWFDRDTKHSRSRFEGQEKRHPMHAPLWSLQPVTFQRGKCTPGHFPDPKDLRRIGSVGSAFGRSGASDLRIFARASFHTNLGFQGPERKDHLFGRDTFVMRALEEFVARGKIWPFVTDMSGGNIADGPL